MKTIKELQLEVYQHYSKAIDQAGLAELHAIEKKIARHYDNGTLSAEQFQRLDLRVFEGLAIGDVI